LQRAFGRPFMSTKSDPSQILHCMRFPTAKRTNGHGSNRYGDGITVIWNLPRRCIPCCIGRSPLVRALSLIGICSAWTGAPSAQMVLFKRARIKGTHLRFLVDGTFHSPDRSIADVFLWCSYDQSARRSSNGIGLEGGSQRQPVTGRRWNGLPEQWCHSINWSAFDRQLLLTPANPARRDYDQSRI